MKHLDYSKEPLTAKSLHNAKNAARKEEAGLQLHPEQFAKLEKEGRIVDGVLDDAVEVVAPGVMDLEARLQSMLSTLSPVDKVLAGEFALAVQAGGSNVINLYAAAKTIFRRAAKLGGRPRALIGSSAGAMAVGALAFNVSEERMHAQMEGTLSNNRLLDGDVLRFAKTGGWSSGQGIYDALTLMIGKETKMGDAAIPVAVVVVDENTSKPMVISSWSNPEVLACDAFAASAMIPFLFESRRIRGLKGPEAKHTFGDGGGIAGLPASFVDGFGCPVVSLKLVSKKAEKARPVRNIVDKLLSWARSLMFASNNAWVSTNPRSITIEVPEFDGLNFAITRDDAVERRKAGEDIFAE